MELSSNKKERFDLDRLQQIPIEDVLEALGAERIGKSKKFHCFNKEAHKAGDKSASLSIHPKDNFCKCFGCGIGGSPVSLVTSKMDNDFVAACEWLHDTFRIPYCSGEELVERPATERQPKIINYIEFDRQRPYNKVALEDWLPHYGKLSDERRLKLIYTAIYRFSLTTDQRAKIAYHASRGIASDHPMQSQIGWLSPNDIKRLARELENTFPKEDLIRFNLFSDMDREYYPGSWKYWSKTGFCVAPSMDLYSDMCNGFVLRNTDASLDKKKLKEIQVSCPSVSYNLPFGLNRDMLLSQEGTTVEITEGYIDGMSLGNDKLFVASTGVHGLKEEMFGLLRGKKVRLAHDMDAPGIRAKDGYWTVSVKRQKDSQDKERVVTRYFPNDDAGLVEKTRYLERIKKFTLLYPNEREHEGLIHKMGKAGVDVSSVKWDPNISGGKFLKDINEILKEYRQIYYSDLTGKTIEEAAKAVASFHQKQGGAAIRQ